MKNLLDSLKENLGIHTFLDVVIEIALLVLWIIPAVRKSFARGRRQK